ncbi:class I SAM-dependent RNA methyltransferase [Nocardia gamkensis]|uniref:Class I SAM-dependent RNA methyltransferase n=3 Tax=Nocardia TaxID=1817 RepID=A0A7X6LAM3_9NOCA|nr:TRAM domain-containing protein [Nocardia gamkensis]NKY31006.1 class I SAM-dependent RNA methyltransferase [Nocardia gamkensis]NQE71826.1 putative RNA methyltransferase [Nocardia gamkensis]
MSDRRTGTFEVRLGPPGHGGFCVARHEGRVVFVRHGLPGELVRVRVTEDRGGSFCRADAVEVLEASPDRVQATCPVSGPGGAGCCDFSFATPVAQRALKATVVAEQLRRLAGIERDVLVEPIGSGDAIGGWRTRVRLAVDAHGRAGVHRYRSTDVIADLRCPQPVAGALDGIAARQWTPGADLVIAVDGDGIRHVVELAPPETEPGSRGADRRGPGASGRQAGGRDRRGGAGSGRRDRPHSRGRRGGEWTAADSTRRDDRRAASARRAAAHAARDEWVFEGSGRAVEYVAGRRWEVAATGFWQAHHGAAQRYSDLIAEWSELGPGGRAWDLYSGAGVFAARLAEQAGRTGVVLAVESARPAVADGAAALRDLPWVELRAQRVERWVFEHIGGAAPDVVVLDPPRAGAGKEVIGAVTASGPARIVHVGCDPAAFARDLGLYQAAGYRLTDLRAFDAFPATHHVECLALLRR